MILYNSPLLHYVMLFLAKAKVYVDDRPLTFPNYAIWAYREMKNLVFWENFQIPPHVRHKDAREGEPTLFLTNTNS